MQTKILFTVNPTGAVPAVTTAGNELYQGQVGTVDYRLEMLQPANLDNWRPTDVVLMRFTRPDGRVNQQIMRYVAGGWELTSNGWETDVDISAHGATLTVGFICKRYSTFDATRVVAEKTTQAVTLQLQPSAGYTPLNIADDGAEEILAQLAQYNADLLGVDDDLQEHKSKTNNPHAVTKAQVGLGHVKNAEQLTAADKAVPGGVASLDDAVRVPLAQIPQLTIEKLPATHQKILWDFTVNSETGVGTKYYTDGTTATVDYPVVEGGAVSSLINVITFSAEHFVGGEISFSPLQTGQADNHYLAFLDRSDGEGFRQTANSVFKGSDGSALISGVAAPFDGRLLVIGAGAGVEVGTRDINITLPAANWIVGSPWGTGNIQSITTPLNDGDSVSYKLPPLSNPAAYKTNKDNIANAGLHIYSADDSTNTISFYAENLPTEDIYLILEVTA